MNCKSYFLLLLLTFWTIPAMSAPLTSEEVAKMSGNVTGFQATAGACHGTVCLLKESAAPFMMGQGNQIVAAVAQYGKGRVFVVGHTSYAEGGFFNGNQELVKNMALWLGQQTELSKINLVTYNGGFVGSLKNLGFNAQTFDAKLLEGENVLGTILLISAVQVSNQNMAQLEKFVENGGSLWISCTPWAQIDDNYQPQHPGNILLRKFGLTYSNQDTDIPNRHFELPAKYSPLINLDSAITALNAENASSLSPADLGVIGQVIGNAVALDPDFDLAKQWKAFDTYYKQLCDAEQNSTQPRPANAFEQSAYRLVMSYINLKAQKYFADPEKAKTVPVSSKRFPGVVADSAQSVTKTVEINTAVPDWASTGLYAAPGATITVKVPEQIAKSGRYAIRIGCHTDQIWHKSPWKRYPSISFTAPLNKETVSVNSVFGGLIYIVVPHGQSGQIPFEISGAIEAPLYVLGKTTKEEWAKMKESSAPWGEMATDKIVISLPTSVLKTVDDPEPVMKRWDLTLDTDAQFVSRPIKRTRPERVVADVELSCGYMHSGYPVMIPVGACSGMATGKGDNWGFFHELGHNHQNYDWVFDGSVEVSVNWFTLYCYEKVDNNPQDVAGGRMNPDYRKRLKESYFARGAKWEDWKRDPFTGLTMFIELKDKYGWDAFIKTIAQYNGLPYSQRPHNDQEKIDQLMIRFSKSVNENLAPFFEKWGMPLSQQAKDAVKDLPPMKE